MVKKNEDEPKFGEAVSELEEILRRIEGEEIDIDELAAELKKASHLLELCRSKIRRAEIEVTQIVQTLDSETLEANEEAISPEDDESS
ncbi:MAG: exodeoxyribonuclease VII small subunit [Acidobacteriota bacterium]|nr:exodeoxyribonuclease VII small subunit [Acidobacteriota bacterium]